MSTKIEDLLSNIDVGLIDIAPAIDTLGHTVANCAIDGGLLIAALNRIADALERVANK